MGQSGKSVIVLHYMSNNNLHTDKYVREPDRIHISAGFNTPAYCPTNDFEMHIVLRQT